KTDVAKVFLVALAEMARGEIGAEAFPKRTAARILDLAAAASGFAAGLLRIAAAAATAQQIVDAFGGGSGCFQRAPQFCGNGFEIVLHLRVAQNIFDSGGRVAQV